MFEINDMKSKIEDTKAHLDKLDQDKKEIDAKVVSHIRVESNKYQKLESELNAIKATIELIHTENKEMKKEINELKLLVKTCIEKKNGKTVNENELIKKDKSNKSLRSNKEKTDEKCVCVWWCKHTNEKMSDVI